MLKQIEKRSLSRIIALLLGVIFAYSITILQPLQLDPTSANIILAGAIAISAMILPGISGSFILLLIGMYAPILGAVKSMDITPLALFASGCIIGLLSLSHVLTWLLKHVARSYSDLLNGFNGGDTTKDMAMERNAQLENKL